jgi:hypothetical protein
MSGLPDLNHGNHARPGNFCKWEIRAIMGLAGEERSGAAIQTPLPSTK